MSDAVSSIDEPDRSGPPMSRRALITGATVTAAATGGGLVAPQHASAAVPIGLLAVVRQFAVSFGAGVAVRVASNWLSSWKSGEPGSYLKDASEDLIDAGFDDFEGSSILELESQTRGDTVYALPARVAGEASKGCVALVRPNGTTQMLEAPAFMSYTSMVEAVQSKNPDLVDKPSVWRSAFLPTSGIYTLGRQSFDDSHMTWFETERGHVSLTYVRTGTDRGTAQAVAANGIFKESESHGSSYELSA